MNSPDRNPRVLFYVQHLLGIGHLARASRIARALVADGFELTMVTGGTPVDGFPGDGVRHMALPAVLAGTGGFSDLVDIDGKPVDDAFKMHRRDLLLAAFHDVKPDVVIIEAFPFGRRQVRFELLPLLAEIESQSPRPILATSLRDILQSKTKPGRDEESVALVARHFDAVLVHGDPAFARLEDSFAKAADIADKIFYTGLVAAPAQKEPQDRFDIVVSAGGGAVGGDVLRASLAAALRLDPSLTWCLITGPNLPEDDVAALIAQAPANVSIVRFRRDFPRLLKAARLSVSQSGYNTVCDILRAGCRALLIPFTTGGETEQTERALRLQKLGAASVLTEDELTADSMTTAITAALAAGPAKTPALDLDGAEQTARLLRRLLAERP